MTIIDELLILLDDVGEMPSEAIPAYFDKPNLQILYSSLGRLVNRGWVSKKSKRQETVYSLTIHGVDELNRTLDAIKQEELNAWDHHWRLVIFDIPETKRKLRDAFRNFLRHEGFGLLKSSVWLSPWDKNEVIKRFIKRHNLANHVIQMETTEIGDTYATVVLVQQSWDWTTIDKAYRQFLSLAEKELPRIKDELKRQRFLAKKLVFLYAEVVRQDPRLPLDIAPNATVARRAHELYTRIRPFCLAEYASDPEVEK